MGRPNIRVNNTTGQDGGAIYTGAGTITPPSGMKIALLEAWTDTVITTAGDSNVSGVDGSTVTADRRLYGRFSNLVIASGTGVVYYDKA
jgi:predicted outer membrane repeat protein